MREKQKKKELEERLAQLQGQMIMGGTKDNLQQTTAFRTALKEQRDRIRKEYESKLKAIEREREGIEEERAQVDRYKQLLLKQRDIMIALTQRLNERDEQIMALQDELDAYDRHQKGEWSGERASLCRCKGYKVSHSLSPSLSLSLPLSPSLSLSLPLSPSLSLSLSLFLSPSHSLSLTLSPSLSLPKNSRRSSTKRRPRSSTCRG